MDSSAARGPVLDADSETVRFNVFVDGRIVRCMASREFLEIKFGAGRDPESWLTACTANMKAIVGIAVDQYRADLQSPVLLHAEN